MAIATIGKIFLVFGGSFAFTGSQLASAAMYRWSLAHSHILADNWSSSSKRRPEALSGLKKASLR